MKTFHIVYFDKNEILYSKGINIDASSMQEALTLFYLQHIDADVFCCINKTIEPIRTKH